MKKKVKRIRLEYSHKADLETYAAHVKELARQGFAVSDGLISLRGGTTKLIKGTQALAKV